MKTPITTKQVRYTVKPNKTQKQQLEHQLALEKMKNDFLIEKMLWTKNLAKGSILLSIFLLIVLIVEALL